MSRLSFLDKRKKNKTDSARLKRLRSLRTLEDKINAESELGRTIFGPIPAGHRREFFEHKKNLWIWHESWEELGIPRSITIRYEVRPTGVYKTVNSSPYKKLEGSELDNFVKATRRYLDLIKTNLYGTAQAE